MSASAFVADWIPRLAPAAAARALDLAMGQGRHALIMARCGFQTFGVDVKWDAVRDAVTAASLERLQIHGWCADLTNYPLPAEAFDLVVVTRYLQRDLFPSLLGTVRPGGHVIYETFTVLQRTLGCGPTSAEHLLAAGELRTYFEAWNALYSEEVSAPEAVARIVAKKPR
jgi:SAM-dependent methyltransferase